jgi:hypothetical protein
MPRYNKSIMKCRKERHFVDFGRRRRDDLDVPSVYQQQMQPVKKVNTIFDVPIQSLTLAPVSYD